MASERVLPQAAVAPANERKLYHQILDSARLGTVGGRRDFEQDMRWYCQLKDIRIESSSHNKPSSEIPLIITPNHYSDKLYSKTSDAFRDVVVTTLACIDQGLSQANTAWFIKRLPIYPVGLGMLVRQVQNASVVTYGSIPVEVKGGKITNREEMTKQYLEAKEKGDNIGFFPEQKPTKVLQRYHPDYIKFLSFLELLYPQGFQILPVAIFNDDRQIHVNFGLVIYAEVGNDKKYVADKTMLTIAQNLPSQLRGPWG